MNRLEYEKFDDYRKRRADERLLDDAHIAGKVVVEGTRNNRAARRAKKRSRWW